VQDLRTPVLFERVVTNLAEQISQSFCYLSPIDIENLLLAFAPIDRNDQVDLESHHRLLPFVNLISHFSLLRSFPYR
jgi:hypothetical protein